MNFHGFELDDKGKHKTGLMGDITPLSGDITWKPQDGRLCSGQLNSTGDRITDGEIFDGMGVFVAKFTGHLETKHSKSALSQVNSNQHADCVYYNVVKVPVNLVILVCTGLVGDRAHIHDLRH